MKHRTLIDIDEEAAVELLCATHMLPSFLVTSQAEFTAIILATITTEA